jgi:hypothetical protein
LSCQFTGLFLVLFIALLPVMGVQVEAQVVATGAAVEEGTAVVVATVVVAITTAAVAAMVSNLIFVG